MGFEEKRKNLVRFLIDSGVLKNKDLIKAFNSVPREKFVLKEFRQFAYVDEPLPILGGQTISQPTTVAIMSEALELKKGLKVLEIGAGSGYQAAILSKAVGPKGKIFTIERLPEVYKFAVKNLKDYTNVKVILGDGSKGLPEEAPFDRIIVTAAAPKIPEKLIQQLKDGGIMVVPVGEGSSQKMFKIIKHKNKIIKEDLGYFVFVPLISEVEEVKNG